MEEKAPTESSEQVELEPDLPPGVEPEEGGAERRFIKKQSALQQDSLIPQGWKPTVRTPVPVVRCAHIFKDSHERAGERCGRWSLRGSRLCYRHSGNGNLRNVEEYRQAIIEAARLQLTEAVPDAMQTLIHLQENSPADNVRLKAATEILDRAGLKAAEQLEVDITVSDRPPAVALAERLEKLRRAGELNAEMQRRQNEAEEERLALPSASVVLPLEDDNEIVVIEGEIIDGE